MSMRRKPKGGRGGGWHVGDLGLKSNNQGKKIFGKKSEKRAFEK
jgi:hypothetical protein